MRKTILIICGILFLFWLVKTDRMPSLVDIGHKIAENILPPTNSSK